MKNTIIILTTFFTGILSCGQINKPASEIKTNDIDTVKRQNIELTYYDTKYIDSTYEYAYPREKRIKIQNSFPKGGSTYTDPNGNVYIYTVFWSRIINETDKHIALAIEFPSQPINLSSDTYIKILLPSTKMTRYNEQLSDYGLSDLDSILENVVHKSSSFHTRIAPNDEYGFYVVTLFNKRVKGVVRTALTLKGQGLYYRINGKEVVCGKLSFKNIDM